MPKVKAWWVEDGSHKLPHGDGRKVKAGGTHKVTGEIVPCNNGLHGSVRLLDALHYVNGTYIWRVELSGTVVKDGDKHVASERTYLWGVECEDVLRAFARRCALDVIHLWDAPEVVVQYLKTGDESLRAAAGVAASAATRSAAGAAARAAAGVKYNRWLHAMVLKEHKRRETP